MDGGPDLAADRRVPVGGPTVNPVMRVMPTKMIETRVPMIDLFNCLVESQKIPIFSVAGEPHNELLARIGFQANADVLVFGGLGLIFDDYHFFRTAFEEHGVFARTVMFVNQASDPLVERLLVPDMALAVAEKFAVEQNKRVLVLLTDMTAYADAMKEIGVAQERIPAVRGYMGDLYTQLAAAVRKGVRFQRRGVGHHPVGHHHAGRRRHAPGPRQHGLYHRGAVLPARRDHRPVRFVVAAEAARGGQSDARGSFANHEHHDPLLLRGGGSAEETGDGLRAVAVRRKLLKFGALFRERFMDIRVSLGVIEALDLCWKTLAECFEPQELLMKQNLVEKYFPKSG
jgi:V/A-type H+/Na+-transporting ATPase subunit B